MLAMPHGRLNSARRFLSLLAFANSTFELATQLIYLIAQSFALIRALNSTL